MTAKARFEICGDAGIVLRQEISHRELTKHPRNLMHVRMRRRQLCRIREISLAIFHGGEKVGMPVNVKLENIVATPLLFCEKEIIWKKEI